MWILPITKYDKTGITTKFEVVEENVCKIDLTDYSHFEKKLIDKDLEKKQVTLQLKITNDSESIKPTGELMLVLDNSESMNQELATGKTRYESIISSANTLVENLLKDNENLKIGIVSFSANADTTKMGSAEDAKLISELDNNATNLTKAINTIEFEGIQTNLEAGITLAQKYYSSENNNKYMIILTDGVPNIAIGDNNIFYDSAINQNAKTFASLADTNISVFTMLTGIGDQYDAYPAGGPDEEKLLPTTDLTNGQIIEKVFGTTEKPNVGKFYYIQDTDIEKTITTEIYNDLQPASKTIKNIKIIDYFPQEIIDNFDFAYVDSPNIGKISAEVDKSNNSIVWNIDELKSQETATVQYTLTLKNNYSSSIVDKILDTNKKVDITFDDENNKPQEKTSDVTPKVRITEETEQKVQEENNTPTDNTVAKTELPDTGSQIFIFTIFVAIAISIIFAIRFNDLKNKMK